LPGQVRRPTIEAICRWKPSLPSVGWSAEDAADRHTQVSGDNAALGLEQKEHRCLHLARAFAVALSLGQDQIGRGEALAEVLGAGLEQRARRVATARPPAAGQALTLAKKKRGHSTDFLFQP
jgi:hypothetical protein